MPGPGQAQNNFNASADVSKELNLLESGSTNVQRGNLLTLPLGGGLVYVQPVYVKSSGSTSFPLLKKVLVAFGDQVGFANTLDEALDQVFGGNSGASAGDAENVDGSTSSKTDTSDAAGTSGDASANGSSGTDGTDSSSGSNSDNDSSSGNTGGSSTMSSRSEERPQRRIPGNEGFRRGHEEGRLVRLWRSAEETSGSVEQGARTRAVVSAQVPYDCCLRKAGVWFLHIWNRSCRRSAYARYAQKHESSIPTASPRKTTFKQSPTFTTLQSYEVDHRPI